MAYAATFTVPDSEVGNADLVFQIRTDRGKLGEMHVSKGAVCWKPARGKLSYKLTWIQLANAAKANGDKVRGT